MKTKNAVQLVGYLGIDPVISKLANGNTKARLRLATDRSRMDNAGVWQRIVTWHDVIAWNKTAEVIAKKLIKGSHIMVEGEINYRTYEDLTGHTRFVTVIDAKLITDLDR